MIERRIIDSVDANMIANRIQMLEVNNDRFRIKSRHLAALIKEMAAA